MILGKAGLAYKSDNHNIIITQRIIRELGVRRGVQAEQEEGLDGQKQVAGSLGLWEEPEPQNRKVQRFGLLGSFASQFCLKNKASVEHNFFPLGLHIPGNYFTMYTFIKTCGIINIYNFSFQ